LLAWSTVQTYAIIDTGIKYKNDVVNPATGYKGDRLVLCLRQRHSRYSGSFDDPCFFSVVDFEA